MTFNILYANLSNNNVVVKNPILFSEQFKCKFYFFKENHIIKWFENDKQWIQLL